MIRVKASDVKTDNVLDEERRWSTGREGQRMFEKSFMNRDEAMEYCILMVEEHPHVGESLNGLAELYSNQASTLRRSRSIKSRWRSERRHWDQSIRKWPPAWRTTPPFYERPTANPRQQHWRPVPRRLGQTTL